VWLSFDPQTGHERAGHWPALVISPESCNRKVGLALFCPITTQRKGYPFEVAVPPGSAVSGVILSDRVKSLDWKAQKTRFGEELPTEILQEVLAKFDALLGM
jgi:mRNA interferase MazF